MSPKRAWVFVFVGWLSVLSFVPRSWASAARPDADAGPNEDATAPPAADGDAGTATSHARSRAPEVDSAHPTDADAGLPAIEGDAAAAPVQDAGALIEVVVTGKRGLAVGESPLAKTTLTPSDVRAAPARTADDLLRGTAEVALPRANSDMEHPTAQSVSMRGVGGGRTLVLFDEVPVNDPFGGWVQWNKVPLSAIDRVEIVRGAAANAYGNLAMGGVIQFFREPPDQERSNVVAEFGALDTYRVYGEGAHSFGAVSASVFANGYQTAGSYVVPANQRGPVDELEPFESKNAGGRVDVRMSDAARAFVSGGYYRADSNTGTALSNNRMELIDVTVGLDLQLGAGTILRERIFFTNEQYHNINTSISTGRTVETLADQNDAPTTRIGDSLIVSHKWARLSALTFGVDAQRIDAINHDLVYDSRGSPQGTKTTVGDQLLIGAFGEWVYTPVRAFTLTAGARGDLWDNFSASTTPIVGPISSLPGRTDGALTPRLGAVYRVAPELALRAAGYGGFRAPTPNELYRSYISGGVTFEPNATLSAERLYGGELGADWSPSRALRTSLTGYVNELYDLIESVSLSSVTSQRENLGEARSLGLEADVRWRVFSPFTVAASYALTDTTVVSSPSAPAVVGKELPTTPEHRGALTAMLWLPGLFDATVRLTTESRAFGDTNNTQRLPAYAELDATLARNLTDWIQVYGSVRNVLGTEIVTGQTSKLTTIGSPRTAWIGVRVTY